MNSILKDMIKDYDLKEDSEVNIAKKSCKKFVYLLFHELISLQKLLL